MKWWNKILLSIFIIIVILIVHISFSTFFPYPFNTLQVALLLLIYIIVLKKSGTTVWLAFVIGFIFDTMTATTFGIFTVSYTLSTLLLFWLFRDVLTQQSFWSIATLTALGLIIFRLIYTLVLIMTKQIIFLDLIKWYSWEFIITITTSILLYFLFGLHKKLYRA